MWDDRTVRPDGGAELVPALNAGIIPETEGHERSPTDRRAREGGVGRRRGSGVWSVRTMYRTAVGLEMI